MPLNLLFSFLQSTLIVRITIR